MAFKLKNGKTPIRKVSMEDGVLGKANKWLTTLITLVAIESNGI